MYEIVLQMHNVVSDMGHLIVMSGEPEQFTKAVDLYQFWLKQLSGDGFNKKEANEKIELFKSQLDKVMKAEEKIMRENLDMAIEREKVEDMAEDTEGSFKLYSKRLNDFLVEKWNNIYKYCGSLNIKLNEKYGK